MKKILLVLGILVFSALLFAHGSDRGFSSRKNSNNRRYTMKEYPEKRFSNKNEKLRIQITLNDFELQKIMVQGRVEWVKVDKLNAQRYRPIKKLENNRLKNREEIRKKFEHGFRGDKYTKDHESQQHRNDRDYERYYMKRYY